MAFTTHGHHISLSGTDGIRPTTIARCGGPTLCGICAKEAAAWHTHDAERNAVTRAVLPEIARDIAFNHIKGVLEVTDEHVEFVPADVYVVWFSKTLQHWKALISTTLPDGRYYELTHNGDSGDTYIDTYVKVNNTVVPYRT